MSTISPAELHNFLKSKGVKYLYCAASVKDACSMINCGTLMSKRQLNFKKLSTTEPTDAELEKAVSLWNKISFYTCDLHGYFTRQNKFGPVCFVINIDFLLDVNERDISISKRNPVNWKKGLKKNRLYYSSVTEFAEHFDFFLPQRIAHKNIILLRDKKSTVDLNKYLVEIIIDKPAHRHLLFTKAKKALMLALEASGIAHIPLKIRECKEFCFCEENYGKMPINEIEKLFLP